MEPITREEYYLAKIAGTYEGNTPEPVTIEEYYLATMAGDYSGNTPQPVTRLQYYMAKVAGVWGGSVPAPVTREEYYWAAIANGEGKVFPPVTREEHFLVLVADAYSVVLTVVTGNPALLENSKGNRGLESLTLYGKSTQMSTTGAQLISLNDSYGVTTVNGVTKTPIGGSVWKLEGISKEKATFSPYSSRDFISLSKGDYVFSVFGTSKAKARYTIVGGISSPYIQTGYSNKISIQEDVKLTFNFIVENGVESNGILMIMLNSGSTSLPYEPYTGGKPSPSPEYPQEIESAGDDGNLNVMVRGKNIFPGPEQPKTVEKNGLTFSYKDGMYTLTGTSNENTWFNIYPVIDTTTSISPTHIGNTICSDGKIAVVNGLKNKLCNISFRNVDNKNRTTVITASNNKKMLQHNTSGVFIYAQPGSYSDTFTLMITDENQTEDYEPYHTPQTLTLSTPNGLPGIPVSSGGNYTDEKGQQWVCDEIDLANGERVQWIKSVTLDGSELWSINGGNNNIKRYFRHDMKGFVEPNYGFCGLSEKLRVVNYSVVDKTPDTNVISFKYFFRMRLADVDIEKGATVDDLKAFLSKNPITVYYAASTPIRTPLPPETIAAYKALRTYSPTTTVINDAGAGMSVGYAKMK